MGLSTGTSPNRTKRKGKRTLVDVIQHSISVRDPRKSEKALRVRVPYQAKERPSTSTSNRYRPHRKLLEPEIRRIGIVKDLEVAHTAPYQSVVYSPEWTEKNRTHHYTDSSWNSKVHLTKHYAMCEHEDLIKDLKEIYNFKTYPELLFKIRKQARKEPKEFIS